MDIKPIPMLSSKAHLLSKKQTIFNSAIRDELIDILAVNTVNEYFWPIYQGRKPQKHF